MKVLMVLDEEFPPDVRVEREIEFLREGGHEADLLCYSMEGRVASSVTNGVNVIRVPISKRLYKTKALALLLPVYFNFWRKAIKSRLDDNRYDVLHFHDLNLAGVSLEAGKSNDLPVIGDYHENRPEIMKWYHHVRSFPGNILISTRKWAQYQVRISKRLDRLILVTEEAKQHYVRQYGIPEEKITVVENYPEVEKLLSLPVEDAIGDRYRGKKVLFYFGDTGLRRGTGTIIETAKLLKDRKEYHFVIMGTSREQQSLRRMVDELKLDNVELTGEKSLGEAVSYFRYAWAGLCPLLRNPHHDTTYANKLFQYMAFGKPVVVSDCEAQATVVRDSACGYIHAAGDAKDLGDKILKLDRDGDYSLFSKNAERAVREKYNASVAKAKLLNLYKELQDEIS